MENYFEQAVYCVKDSVLPMQRKIYEQCGGDFDRIYGEAMNSDLYTGKVIEPGHIYELGYHTCTCPKVLSGMVRDPEHCECTRQSILYILHQLELSGMFEVDILETVLRGCGHCRFRITKMGRREEK